jgi:hypothetical protein
MDTTLGTDLSVEAYALSRKKVRFHNPVNGPLPRYVDIVIPGASVAIVGGSSDSRTIAKDDFIVNLKIFHLRFVFLQGIRDFP